MNQNLDLCGFQENKFECLQSFQQTFHVKFELSHIYNNLQQTCNISLLVSSLLPLLQN